MIDVDATFKAIRTVYQTISGKGDNDVSLTFKGTGYGVTQPWVAKIDARETKHEEYDGALTSLLTMLKKELADKTRSAENEALRLRQALNQLGN
jgi:hypothetical protein